MEYGGLSLLPPIVAIVAAFITRKIVLSLASGILVGTLISSKGNIFLALEKAFTIFWEKTEFSHFQSWEQFQSSWNLFVILFCCLLGAIINLLNRAGGARAYGVWAAGKVKSRLGAQMSTMFLGIIIFFDDYFNCLTVGAVMQPVTDKFKISRAKLAFIIDSTTAPVCILAPLSSWVVEVITQLKNAGIEEHLAPQIFLESIFFNFYAWFALLMVALVSIFKWDFGPMRKHEKIAEETGNLFGGTLPDVSQEENVSSAEGRLRDLLLPLGVLISAIVYFMFSYNTAQSLFWGGVIGLSFTIIFFFVEKTMTLREMARTILMSTKTMFPVVMTLILAWSISEVIKEEVKTGEYLSHFLTSSFILFLLPAIVFLLSGIVAFATGTSWGTFAIMIPIIVPLSAKVSPDLLVPMLAAVLSGSVYGDHTSPISDTTILSSIGAGCPHMDHVATQSPYSGMVAIVSLFSFVLSGLCLQFDIFYPFLVGIVFGLVALPLFLRAFSKKGFSEGSPV